MTIYNTFEEWFNELEGFGFRSERLYETLVDQSHPDFRAQLGQWLRAAFDAGRSAVDAKQAHIDELMLEYCPEDITDEQWAEYARHQVAVDPDALDAYNEERLVSRFDKGTGL